MPLGASLPDGGGREEGAPKAEGTAGTAGGGAGNDAGEGGVLLRRAPRGGATHPPETAVQIGPALAGLPAGHQGTSRRACPALQCVCILPGPTLGAAGGKLTPAGPSPEGIVRPAAPGRRGSLFKPPAAGNRPVAQETSSTVINSFFCNIYIFF